MLVRQAAAAAVVSVALIAATHGSAVASTAPPRPAPAHTVSAAVPHQSSVSANLKTFDTYDFAVFNAQKWDRVHESHADDIVVYQPDGSITRGLTKHLEELKQYFVYAPNARISQHTFSFGSCDETSVGGIFEGTFTKPMPDGKGGFIAPTNKSFKVPIATISRWRDGKIVEKHVYLDVHAFLVQLGLAS